MCSELQNPVSQEVAEDCHSLQDGPLCPLDICPGGIGKATYKLRSNQKWNDGALGVTEDTTRGRGPDNSKV